MSAAPRPTGRQPAPRKAEPLPVPADFPTDVGADEGVICDLVLSLTPSEREHLARVGNSEKQAQLKVESSGGFPEALAARGIAQGEISANKGKNLLIDVRTKDGTTVTLRMGDTHAVWARHQKGQALDLFRAMYQTISEDEGASAQLTVVGLRYSQLVTGGAVVRF